MILRPERLRLVAVGLPTTPANKTSDSSSSSATTNTYQDRRNAVQGGVGVSGDGNTTNTNIVSADPTVAQAAISGVVTAANNANTNMATVSADTVAASSHLADVGLSMLQANTALANSLMGGVQQSTQAVTQIASQLASTQVAAQNDNRYLIAAGLAVVGIVGFAAFGKGKV